MFSSGRFTVAVARGWYLLVAIRVAAQNRAVILLEGDREGGVSLDKRSQYRPSLLIGIQGRQRHINLRDHIVIIQESTGFSSQGRRCGSQNSYLVQISNISECTITDRSNGCRKGNLITLRAIKSRRTNRMQFGALDVDSVQIAQLIESMVTNRLYICRNHHGAGNIRIVTECIVANRLQRRRQRRDSRERAVLECFVADALQTFRQGDTTYINTTESHVCDSGYRIVVTVVFNTGRNNTRTLIGKIIVIVINNGSGEVIRVQIIPNFVHVNSRI